MKRAIKRLIEELHDMAIAAYVCIFLSEKEVRDE